MIPGVPTQATPPPCTTVALRTSHCDLFVYETRFSGYECVNCLLDGEGGMKHLAGARELMEHIQVHQRAGHKVPGSMIAEAVKERAAEMAREQNYKHLRDQEAAIVGERQQRVASRKGPKLMPQYPGLGHKDLMRT